MLHQLLRESDGTVVVVVGMVGVYWPIDMLFQPYLASTATTDVDDGQAGRRRGLDSFSHWETTNLSFLNVVRIFAHGSSSVESSSINSKRESGLGND